MSSVPFIFATESGSGLELSVMVAPSTLLTLPLTVGTGLLTITGVYTNYDPGDRPPKGSLPLGCWCNGDFSTVTDIPGFK